MNWILFQILILASFLAPVFAEERTGLFGSRPWINSAKVFVLEILREFPPQEFHYVGIGRSPTPVMAIIDEIDSNLVSNVPLSKMREHPNPGANRVTDILRDHFDRFFPSEEILRGKGVVVIDTVLEGASFINAVDHIEYYIDSSGRDTKIKYVPIMQPTSHSIHRTPEFRSRGWHPIQFEVNINEIEYFFMKEMFDDNAEYGEFIPGETNSASLSKRKEYRDFCKKTVRRLLDEDLGFWIQVNEIIPGRISSGSLFLKSCKRDLRWISRSIKKARRRVLADF